MDLIVIQMIGTVALLFGQLSGAIWDLIIRGR
jgi:hypothetical protein